MKDVFKKIIVKHNLGSNLERVIPITGGQLHHMYRIKTDANDVAIKIINAEIAKNRHFKENYELSEKIASTFQTKGLPAVSALFIDGNYVHTHENIKYLVYPFVEGKLLSRSEITEDKAAIVGEMFAVMHHVGKEIQIESNVHYDYFGEKHWEALIDDLHHSELTTLKHTILKWNETYQASQERLSLLSVVTHRDMHLNNVIWDSNDRPHILDWESAGKMNPMMEVVGYGLEWSGIITNARIDQTLLKTILMSYSSSGEADIDNTSISDPFYGWLGHCVLAWTEFNLRRMRGEISGSKKERRRGKNIINTLMIPCLKFIQRNERNILDMLTDI